MNVVKTVDAKDLKQGDVIMAAGRYCKVKRVLNMRHYISVDLVDVIDELFELEIKCFPHASIDLTSTSA